jgi:hypothetical protein
MRSHRGLVALSVDPEMNRLLELLHLPLEVVSHRAYLRASIGLAFRGQVPKVETRPGALFADHTIREPARDQPIVAERTALTRDSCL